MIHIFSVVLFAGLAMIVHELGHLVAARTCKVSASELGLGLGPRLLGFRLGGITFSLRAFPIASFLRVDGTALEVRSLPQQLLVHLGGIIFNLIAAFLAYGTIFGWVSLLVATSNLFPLYRHDGWKCGVAIMRALLRKKSESVEWAFTFSGGLVSLIIVGTVFHLLRLK